MFRRKTRQDQAQRNSLRQAVDDARKERDEAETALNEAALYSLISDVPSRVRRDINRLALQGWRLIHMNTNSLYAFDGETQVTAVLENQQWDEEAHRQAELAYDEAQAKLRKAEADERGR